MPENDSVIPYAWKWLRDLLCTKTSPRFITIFRLPANWHVKYDHCVMYVRKRQSSPTLQKSMFWFAVVIFKLNTEFIVLRFIFSDRKLIRTKVRWKPRRTFRFTHNNAFIIVQTFYLTVQTSQNKQSHLIFTKCTKNNKTI